MTDIHTETAAQMFDLPITEVTPEHRRLAKSRNFLKMYGTGIRSFKEEMYTFIERGDRLSWKDTHNSEGRLFTAHYEGKVIDIDWMVPHNVYFYRVYENESRETKIYEDCTSSTVHAKRLAERYLGLREDEHVFTN